MYIVQAKGAYKILYYRGDNYIKYCASRIAKIPCKLQNIKNRKS